MLYSDTTKKTTKLYNSIGKNFGILDRKTNIDLSILPEYFDLKKAEEFSLLVEKANIYSLVKNKKHNDDIMSRVFLIFLLSSLDYRDNLDMLVSNNKNISKAFYEITVLSLKHFESAKEANNYVTFVSKKINYLNKFNTEKTWA